MKLSIPGLAIAAAIAPAVTMGLGSMFLWDFETVPDIVGMSGSSAATRELFAHTSLGSELLNSFGRLLYDIFFGPFLAIPFGFAGAAIFLAPSFALASLKGDIRGYMIAGGLSGAAHAIGGTLLAHLLVGSYAWLNLILGFMPYGFRQIAAVTTALSAPVAGVLVGYLYGRMVGATRAKRRGRPNHQGEPRSVS